MGMFDRYRPSELLACPVCGTPLQQWQGKDGPCGLFVWQQGHTAPIAQEADDDSRLSDDALVVWRLPESFTIYSYDCSCPFPVEAIGMTSYGTWATTELVTAANAQQRSSETRAQFKARLRWLQGKGP
jgi:hypothetical protein